MDLILLFKTLIMGLVEGVTEFLPISSTGYLILTARLIDFWTPEKADLFSVVIQFGAMLAVVYNYFGRLWRGFTGLFSADKQRRNFGLALILATVPVIVLGFLAADFIKAALFNAYVVATMLIVGGLLIFWVENRERPLIAKQAEDVSLKTALQIGLFQCLALIPGTSRSGATIIGALYLGVSRKAAAEFSFFLGIPVLFGAGLLDFVTELPNLESSDFSVLLVGTAASFVFALLTIRWLVDWVSSRDFKIFGWLRIVTGVVVLVTGLTGFIDWG